MVVFGFDVVVTTAVVGSFVTVFKVLVACDGADISDVVATEVALASILDDSLAVIGLELTRSD